MLSNNYQDTVDHLNTAFHLLDAKLFNSSLQSDERRVLVTIQAKGNHNAYGWCSVKERWNDGDGLAWEINMSAEHLGRPLYETLGTLIHEMVHLDHIFRGIQDTSRKGVYHNKKFKAGAEAVGLVVSETDKHGYAHTEVPPDLKARLEVLLNPTGLLMDEPLNIARLEPGLALKVKVKKASTTYTCPDCGTSFKTSKKGLRIVCEDCNEPMLEEDDE